MAATVTQVVESPQTAHTGEFLTLQNPATKAEVMSSQKAKQTVHVISSGHAKVSKHSGSGSNVPSVIEKGALRIVITDSPSEFTMEQYIRELIRYNVKHVCRACEPSYSTDALIKCGITVHDFVFADGDPPPDSILSRWLDTVQTCFKTGPDMLSPNERIAVHCVAGLGRAPVLVAVALVEFCNMEPLEAVEFIRKQRRGAINRRQLKWLEEYVPRRTQNKCAGCVIC